MRRSIVNKLLLHAHSVAPLLCAPQTLTAPLLRTPLTANCAQHRTQMKSRALRIWVRLCCTISRRESTMAAMQPVVALLRAAAALLWPLSTPHPYSAVLAVCITSWSDERAVKWSGILAASDAAMRELSWWAPCCRMSAITLRYASATWAARPTHQSPSSARLSAHHAVARAAATQASGSSTAWIVSSSSPAPGQAVINRHQRRRKTPLSSQPH